MPVSLEDTMTCKRVSGSSSKKKNNNGATNKERTMAPVTQICDRCVIS